jgi:hypothetical protein
MSEFDRSTSCDVENVSEPLLERTIIDPHKERRPIAERVLQKLREAGFGCELAAPDDI